MRWLIVTTWLLTGGLFVAAGWVGQGAVAGLVVAGVWSGLTTIGCVLFVLHTTPVFEEDDE